MTVSLDDVAATIADPIVSIVFAKKIITSTRFVLLQYLSVIVNRLETRLWSFKDVINVEESNLRRESLDGGDEYGGT